MSDDRPVHLTTQGPPATILDREPDEALAALAHALGQPPDDRRAAISAVVAKWPRFCDGWAQLGLHARDDVEAYAAFRVGYHRGLDRLRANGWKGSGFVRWTHVENQGFLRALRGLRDMAARIAEDDEARRCELFILQLDPAGVPAQG